MTCCALIALRFREPDLDRPFRVPLNAGRVPLVAVVGIATIVPMFLQFEPTVYIAAAVAALAGVGIYEFVRRGPGARGRVPHIPKSGTFSLNGE